MLDLCYSNIRDAYKSYRLPPIGSSDHCSIQLVPTYIANHRKKKHQKVTKTVIDEETLDKCKACFATTAWDEFIDHNNIDNSAETIMDYISFSISSSSTTKSFGLNNNSRPWLTREIKGLIKQRYQAKKNKNDSHCKTIRDAKLAYKDKMLNQMTGNMKQAWQGIKAMSHLNKSSPQSSHQSPSDELKLSNELNNFYIRFDNTVNNHTVPLPQTKLSDIEQFTTTEVTQALSKCKQGKASGPDNIPPSIIKACAPEIAPIFTTLFNMCLVQGYIPRVWRKSEIVPVPKNQQPKTLNDYRPIALTPIIMKCFEHLIKQRLVPLLTLDEHQFAYRKDRSTKDACLSLDYYIRSHLESSKAYVRVLFVDFSSAFNTISPNILVDRLKSMNVPNVFSNLILSFLRDRQQYVKLNSQISDVLSCSTGCPQGCVLSPLLFSIYTDFIRSEHKDVKIFKYADDMAIVGLLNHQNSDNNYFTAIDNFTEWCSRNELILNTDKTKEMIINFSQTHSVESDVIVNSRPIEQVHQFKYLGTIFSSNLKWQDNTEAILRKLKSRFYALSKFKSFSPSYQQVQSFINTLILPIFMYNSEIWFYSCTAAERTKLLRLFNRARFNCDINILVSRYILNTTHMILKHEQHILHELYKKPRHFYTSHKCRTVRFSNSFIPLSIRLLNGQVC
jgi:hypothetical protein